MLNEKCLSGSGKRRHFLFINFTKKHVFQSHRVFATIISFTGELFKRGSEKTSGELQAGNRGANKRWMKRIIVISDIHWL